MTSSSRALIVGIMAVCGRRLTAPQLVRLAGPLGLSATNVKSHLTRLVTEGALERSGPPRGATYEPSAKQMTIIDGIRSRLMQTPDPEWDGTWLMLTLGLPRDRAIRAQMRASLWFDGFRSVGTNVFTRPAWPVPWAKDRASSYLDLSGGICFQGKVISDREGHELARSYDVDGLDAEACLLAKWIETRNKRVGSLRAAFVERMNVGGRVARFIGHDPRLPRAVWGNRHGMEEVVKRFRRFEARVAAKADRFVESVIENG